MDRNKRVDNVDAGWIRRTFLYALAVYTLLVVLFYFLAGDQLRFRDSRENVDMAPADTGSIELTAGTRVEQCFSVKIDRLRTIGVQWGAFYRQNTGTVTIELLRAGDGTELLTRQYDAASITEGLVLTMEAEEPIEGVYDVPLLLRITADSPAGMGATPLLCSDPAAAGEKKSEENGYALYINGERAGGVLCFFASGEDYIWTGQNYWKFVIGLGVFLCVLFFLAWARYDAGKRSYPIEAMLALRKYRFLIRQLVSRDFKTRYKRSVLGMFWSVLNPLLTMMVQYFVFSTIFRNDVPNFAVYLLIGVVMFGFFSESTGLTLTSILGNAGLITKVYMPKYIYPLTRTLSSLVNLALSLVPLVIMCLATHVELKKSALLALFFFACLVIFTLGLGMLLATSMVFFRDTQFLWGVLSMMWMYATPIFYPERILPENLRFVLKINPLYFFIRNARVCILNGISPEPLEYVYCTLIALAMLLVGAFVFWREQNKFVLYL